MTQWSFLVGILALFLVACGDDGGETTSNNQTTGCVTDNDCEGDTSAEFVNPDSLSCETNIAGERYCSECLNDLNCGPGYRCINRTYCESLPPCTTSRDCTSEGELVHFACLNGGCQFCTDDFQCGSSDLICFSRTCVPKDNVAEECINASCGNGEGMCPLERDDDGKSVGYICVP